MALRRLGLTSATAVSLLLVSHADAQTLGGNEAWLGQSGGTNVIDINQEGRSNAAGADNVDLRIDQFGDGNRLVIDQYGWSNQAGAEMMASGPLGIEQRGDGNDIDIRQSNYQDGGSNIVGAVLQFSPFLNLTPANILRIVQNAFGSAPGGAGAAGHYIGTVVQINNLLGAVANFARIQQEEGGVGQGNTLASLRQEGFANSFDLLQSGQLNSAEIVRQIGSGNIANVIQDRGERNLLRFLDQLGFGNISEIRMSGSRNGIELVLQTNELLGPSAEGNRIQVTIAGDDNGTEFGAIGSFLSDAALAVTGISQGTLQQFGAGNNIRLKIGGDENRFGLTQTGDGNTAFVAIGDPDGRSARNNESAIYQFGDSNVAFHDVYGRDNVAAVGQQGESNNVHISQRGRENVAEVSITGDFNNATGRGFGGSALQVAGALTSGQIVQRGFANAASAAVVGSDNDFAFSQTGVGHTIVSLQSGATNQVAVVQTGVSNTSLSNQSGAGHSLGVRQH